MKTITVQFDTWRRGWADQCGLEDGEQVIPWLTIVHLSGQFMNATDVNTDDKLLFSGLSDVHRTHKKAVEGVGDDQDLT